MKWFQPPCHSATTVVLLLQGKMLQRGQLITWGHERKMFPEGKDQASLHWSETEAIPSTGIKFKARQNSQMNLQADSNGNLWKQ